MSFPRRRESRSGSWLVTMLRLSACSTRSSFHSPDHRQKLVEEIEIVQRARRCLGVVLDGHNGQLTVMQPFHRPIVEIDVTDFQASFQGVSINSIAMVLSGDVYPARLNIAYRVIAAAMPELQLERPGSERLADELF